MKLIFLDVDGVMNSIRGEGPYHADMEEGKLLLLKELTSKDDDTYVVLTSDRRELRSYQKEFSDAMTDFGIPYAGMTRYPDPDRLDDNRGIQIMDYLIASDHPVDSLVILDDNDDGISPLFPDQLALISRTRGLTEDYVATIDAILRPKAA